MIYVDISDLYQARLMTGIQRVVRELLWRLLRDHRLEGEIRVVSFDPQKHDYLSLNLNSVQELLLDPQVAMVKIDSRLPLDGIKKDDIFFDLDAAWNVPLKRLYLYKRLKEQGAEIFTYIYDLVPAKFPMYAHPNTFRNFATYLTAVYSYCDLAFFISRSSERDFLDIARSISLRRQIPTVVTKLGCDFLQEEKEKFDTTDPDLMALYNQLLEKKYILFVGTLEPRKCQSLAVEAFSALANEHPDLNLVLIGKKGWLVDNLVDKIRSHPLYKKRLHWLESVNDKWLKEFYQHAYMGIYCSEYEGFGLPIAESLSHNMPTITSNNSSMYEVGKGFADYLQYNSRIELIEIIGMYLNDATLYEQKCDHIRENYEPYRWERIYGTVAEVLLRYRRSREMLRRRTAKLQHVLISVRYEDAERMIKATDKFVKCIKEYIIVTRPELVSRFSQIKSDYEITVIDESKLLGDKISIFQEADHFQKNWMLRATLPYLDMLDEEFIMLDDDNIPIKPVDLDHFKDDTGRYKAYHFHELPEWRSWKWSYDRGQHTTCAILDERVMELLSYSSHCPQIINKELFKEVVEEFQDDAMKAGTDEWSTYFNYSVTRYPFLFRKCKFQTLNWPASPQHWRSLVDPDEYTYENYYPWVYDGGDFQGLGDSDYDLKISKKKEQLVPFIQTEAVNQDFQIELQKQDLVHGVLKFEHENVRVYISGIPFVIFIAEHAYYWMDVHYKIIGAVSDKEEYLFVARRGIHQFSDIQLHDGQKLKPGALNEGNVLLPIKGGTAGKVQDLHFTVERNGVPMKQSGQLYLSKLFNITAGETGYDKIDISS